MRENFYQLSGFFVFDPGSEVVVGDSGDGLLVPGEGLDVVACPDPALEGSAPLVVRGLRVAGKTTVGFQVLEGVIVHFGANFIELFVADGDLAVVGFENPEF
jgi:hypothetical protein